MTKLKNQACSACSPDSALVTTQQVIELMPQVPEWQLLEVDGVQRLERLFSFTNFADALVFTNKIGEIAEQVGHHPMLVTEWGRVKVAWWTHKINGVHVNDFIMAARTDERYC